MKKTILSISIIIFCALTLIGCQSYSDDYNSSQTADNSENSIVAPTEAELALATDEETFKGPNDAEVVFVELADFECPACKSYFSEIKKFTDEYSDRVKFVYLHYPLSYHENAQEAALAMEAAGKQGKAWEMYDALYSLNKLNSETIKQTAEDLGLDMNQFETDRNSEELSAKIDSHKAKGKAISLSGTPTFYINGTQINFSPTYENLKQQVDQLLE